MTARTNEATILGVDLGSQRVGVAIADVGGLSARPLTTLATGAGSGAGEPFGAVLAALGELAREHRATELVVGLPVHANGQEGDMARSARSFAAAAAARLGIPVTLRDERLSSSVAESRLGPMPRGRSGGPPSRVQRERYRARVDREAAAIILQDELDSRLSR